MIDEETPPLQLGPFQVEHLGRRGGLLTLQIRIGRHTVLVFADCGNMGARVSAEIDGKQLTRRRKPRRWRRWSNDLTVKRWVLAAAAEVDEGGAPKWACKEIAQNLKRARRGEMTGEAVRRLLWKLAPDLAQRRADYQRTIGARLKRLGKKNTGTRETRAAQRAAVVAEMKKAGVLGRRSLASGA